MKPWQILGKCRTPDGTELTLKRHPSEFVIMANGRSLMSSRMHGSEEALSTIGCARVRRRRDPRVLVGGLGMGFTLRAALDCLPSQAEVVVSELVDDVVTWNRGPLADLAGRPLDDPRVRLVVGDVLGLLRQSCGVFDAVLLDVDNGPAAVTTSTNSHLYGLRGLAAAHRALKPGGVLAVWSANDDPRFRTRLRDVGFEVRVERVRGRRDGSSPWHAIVTGHVPRTPVRPTRRP
ncbi:MAG: hypothetical protein U0Q12_16630 [Vicinamibacterales bacterium]